MGRREGGARRTGRRGPRSLKEGIHVRVRGSPPSLACAQQDVGGHRHVVVGLAQGLRRLVLLEAHRDQLLQGLGRRPQFSRGAPDKGAGPTSWTSSSASRQNLSRDGGGTSAGHRPAIMGKYEGGATVRPGGTPGRAGALALPDGKAPRTPGGSWPRRSRSRRAPPGVGVGPGGGVRPPPADRPSAPRPALRPAGCAPRRQRRGRERPGRPARLPTARALTRHAATARGTPRW